MATKYLHLFNTEQAFQTAYGANTYEEPWVSLTTATGEVNYNKPKFFLNLSNYQWPDGILSIELEDSDVEAFLDFADEHEFISGDVIRVLDPDGYVDLYAFVERTSTHYTFTWSSDLTDEYFLEIYFDDFNNEQETGGLWSMHSPNVSPK